MKNAFGSQETIIGTETIIGVSGGIETLGRREGIGGA
jgi:hypothetical protein